MITQALYYLCIAVRQKDYDYLPVEYRLVQVGLTHTMLKSYEEINCLVFSTTKEGKGIVP